MKHSIFIIFGIFIMIAFVQTGCKPEEEAEPPVINLIIEDDCTNGGDTVEIGHALRFKISASGTDANITNFLIEKHYGDTKKTVVDSGLNSAGFTVNQVFYQGVEDEVDWTFTVMDRNRKSASVSLKVYKDPNSQYGGIIDRRRRSGRRRLRPGRGAPFERSGRDPGARAGSHGRRRPLLRAAGRDAPGSRSRGAVGQVGGFDSGDRRLGRCRPCARRDRRHRP